MHRMFTPGRGGAAENGGHLTPTTGRMDIPGAAPAEEAVVPLAVEEALVPVQIIVAAAPPPLPVEIIAAAAPPPLPVEAGLWHPKESLREGDSVLILAHTGKWDLWRFDHWCGVSANAVVSPTDGSFPWFQVDSEGIFRALPTYDLSYDPSAYEALYSRFRQW